MKIKPIPKSVSEYLRLDTSSGSGLVWIKSPGGGTAVGKQAGHLHKKKQRWSVKFQGQLYYCYRIVYYLRTGIDPDQKQIDHAAHETNTNNNLRLATQSENMANTNIRSDNTSGIKGVSFDKGRNKWKSKINVGGREIYLGRFNTIEEAIHARRAGEVKYHGDFALLNPI